MPLWPGWTWRDALRVCKRRLPSLRRSMKRYVTVLYLQTGLSELKDCGSDTDATAIKVNRSFVRYLL